AARGLPALLARAVPRDPQVIAAQAALATTEARYKQARSRLFPTAALQATRGRGNDLDGTQEVERRTHQVEASVRWNVYNGGADRAELDAAERGKAGRSVFRHAAPGTQPAAVAGTPARRDAAGAAGDAPGGTG
ncbi:MAG: TolC family protein, partial [Janthinobacterium sp.]